MLAFTGLSWFESRNGWIVRVVLFGWVAGWLRRGEREGGKEVGLNSIAHHLEFKGCDGQYTSKRTKTWT